MPWRHPGFKANDRGTPNKTQCQHCGWSAGEHFGSQCLSCPTERESTDQEKARKPKIGFPKRFTMERKNLVVRTQRRADLTLRQLQVSLPWSVKYSGDFRSNAQPHKDFAHALVHIVKASGRLAALVDDMDHDRDTVIRQAAPITHGRFVADLVVCALRLANTFPGQVLDLQKEVVARIEGKNGVRL